MWRSLSVYAGKCEGHHLQGEEHPCEKTKFPYFPKHGFFVQVLLPVRKWEMPQVLCWLEDKPPGSVRSKSWPDTAHKHSFPWHFHVFFFTSSILDINPPFAVLILWAVKDMASLHFWFRKTVTKTKDKYVFRSSMMYCVSYNYLLAFDS